MVRVLLLVAIGFGLAGCGLPLEDNPTPFHCTKNNTHAVSCS